jgi:hypothetical protein
MAKRGYAHHGFASAVHSNDDDEDGGAESLVGLSLSYSLAGSLSPLGTRGVAITTTTPTHAAAWMDSASLRGTPPHTTAHNSPPTASPKSQIRESQ